MDRTLEVPTPTEAVRALFAEPGRRWAAHDQVVSELIRRCYLDRRAVERALDRLLANGGLDAITVCHCPPGATQMVVESGYQPGPRLLPGWGSAVA
jgi:hypothetical protein